MVSKIHTGPKGGKYYIKNGRKVYISGETSPHKIKVVAGHHPHHKGVGRGGITRGWREDAPHNPRARASLAHGCGDECFLLPAQRKFPICKKCNNEICSCKKDCRGIKAAQIRARQYGYNRVASRAEKLYDERC